MMGFSSQLFTLAAYTPSHKNVRLQVVSAISVLSSQSRVLDDRFRPQHGWLLSGIALSRTRNGLSWRRFFWCKVLAQGFQPFQNMDWCQTADQGGDHLTLAQVEFMWLWWSISGTTSIFWICTLSFLSNRQFCKLRLHFFTLRDRWEFFCCCCVTATFLQEGCPDNTATVRGVPWLHGTAGSCVFVWAGFASFHLVLNTAAIPVCGSDPVCGFHQRSYFASLGDITFLLGWKQMGGPWGGLSKCHCQTVFEQRKFL